MQHRTVPRNGDLLSALGLGCMRLPTNPLGGVDVGATERLIHRAIDQGVNYFDTAATYHGGKSEAILGRALSGGKRDKVFITTKLPQWQIFGRKDMDECLERQLRDLQTDTIDYYLLHSMQGIDQWKRLEELGVRDFLEKAVQSGRVRNLGFSYHGPEAEFPKLVDAYPWQICMIQYNYVDKHNQAGVSGLRYAASKNLGVVVMEPLRGGHLVGRLPKQVQGVFDKAATARSSAEWALRWVWDQPEVTLLISGMGTAEQLDENARIAEEGLPGSLTDEERALVEEAADFLNEAIRVPCTGCRYCMPCPAGVNIPNAFDHYNSKFLFNDKLIPRAMYLAQNDIMHPEGKALASQCTECGLCEDHCPQNIAIQDELKKVVRTFEKGPLTPLLRFIIRVRVGGRSRG